MDFLNMNINPEEGNNSEDKYPKLEAWFDFMNNQMEKLERVREVGKINSILIDNDIELID